LLCVLATLVLAWPARELQKEELLAQAAPAPAANSSHKPLPWRRMALALAGYTLFGVGYIGYMTFVIALLREQGVRPGAITLFYALLGLAESPGCRRVALLGYFGETATPCGNCDICDDPPQTFDGTEAAQKVLSAVLRTGESYGAGHIIDVLFGTETDRIRARGHDRLPTFGVGADLDDMGWRSVFRQLLASGLLEADAQAYGALKLTEAARPILKGETALSLRRHIARAKGKVTKTGAITATAHAVLRGETRVTLRRDLIKRARPAVVVRTQVDDEDAPLLSALKAQRRALAEAQRVPAYVIFPDRTLIEMAQSRPQTLDEMARVNGVGAKKLESYGEAFLRVIAGEVAPMHPSRKALAGRASGELFDRLAEAQQRLARGEDGTEKPLSVGNPVLRRIAEDRPRDLARYLDPARLDRFGAAFRAEIEAD
jgi:ATP-dependent DNA helicase RecQ